jgi:TRAP-type C4-dicarboxylate transport system substrate-binding protein
VLGAEGVEMGWGQVYTALKLGLVDGAENSVSALIVGRHGEVVTHYSMNEHTMVPDVFLVSTARWQSFTRAQQRIIREAATASHHHMNTEWLAFEQMNRDVLTRMGVILVRPDKAAFAEKAAALTADLADGRTADLLRRIARS